MTTFVVLLILLAAAAAVIWPIVRRFEPQEEALVEDMELGEALAQRDAALLAIDELEADFQMGNLSEPDYTELRRKYDEQAVTVLKSVDEVRGIRAQVKDSELDDEIEARVAARRNSRRIIPTDLDGEIEARVAARRRARQPRPGAGTAAEPRRCPACGRALVAGASFCAYCGASAAVTCPECHAAITTNDRFCGSCGAALKPVAAEQP